MQVRYTIGVVERSVPIPAFTSKGLGRRQCTERWKIRPIHKLLRQELGFEKVTAQLALTWDEVWRMRDSPTKYVTNAYPTDRPSAPPRRVHRDHRAGGPASAAAQCLCLLSAEEH